MDWVEIAPGREGHAATAAALLALAQHSSDVRTAGAGDVFLVPPYLADLYMPPVPEAPAPKRRRAKKEEGDE